MKEKNVCVLKRQTRDKDYKYIYTFLHCDSFSCVSSAKFVFECLVANGAIDSCDQVHVFQVVVQVLFALKNFFTNCTICSFLALIFDNIVRHVYERFSKFYLIFSSIMNSDAVFIQRCLICKSCWLRTNFTHIFFGSFSFVLFLITRYPVGVFTRCLTDLCRCTWSFVAKIYSQ